MHESCGSAASFGTQRYFLMRNAVEGEGVQGGNKDNEGTKHLRLGGIDV